MTVGGDRKSKPQNEAFHRGKTSAAVANEHGVSKATVERAAAFCKGVDTAERIERGTRDAILSGKSKIPQNVIASIPKMEPEEQHEVIAAAKSGSAWPTKKVKNGANGLKR